MASTAVEVIDPVELLLNPGTRQRKKKVMTEWYEGCTTCTECNKTFATKCALDIHVRTHTGEKPYQCKLCLKTFTQRAHIKRHALVHSKPAGTEPPKTYECENCKQVFKDPRAYTRHKNIHMGFELRFKCTVCSRSYARSSSLSAHMVTHEAGYPCKECSDVFMTFPELRTHKIKAHKRPTLHCDLCDKYFYHQSDLKIHNRKHSTSRPFNCEFCGKSFKSVSHVNRHVKTHKEYVPKPRSKYPPCVRCGQLLNTQLEILTHKCDGSDPLFPFTCAECYNGYVNKVELRRHVMEHFPSPKISPVLREGGKKPQQISNPAESTKTGDTST